MMLRKQLTTLCLLAAGFSLAGTGFAATLRSLPAAVQRTAREQSKGATIRSIDREIEGGKTVYEVSMRVNGRSRDIIIGADGALLVAEDQVELASLPEAVRSNIVKSAGKGKIVVIESVSKAGTLAYYEAQIRTRGKVSEVKVGLDGELIPPDGK